MEHRPSCSHCLPSPLSLEFPLPGTFCGRPGTSAENMKWHSLLVRSRRNRFLTNKENSLPRLNESEGNEGWCKEGGWTHALCYFRLAWLQKGSVCAASPSAQPWPVSCGTISAQKLLLLFRGRGLWWRQDLRTICSPFGKLPPF